MNVDKLVKRIFLLIPLSVLASIFIELIKIDRIVSYNLLAALAIGFVGRGELISGWKIIFRDILKLCKKIKIR